MLSFAPLALYSFTLAQLQSIAPRLSQAFYTFWHHQRRPPHSSPSVQAKRDRPRSPTPGEYLGNDRFTRARTHSPADQWLHPAYGSPVTPIQPWQTTLGAAMLPAPTRVGTARRLAQIATVALLQYACNHSPLANCRSAMTETKGATRSATNAATETVTIGARTGRARSGRARTAAKTGPVMSAARSGGTSDRATTAATASRGKTTAATTGETSAGGRQTGTGLCMHSPSDEADRFRRR